MLIIFLSSAVFGLGVGTWLVWQHARRQRRIAEFMRLSRIRQLEDELLHLRTHPLETPWCQFQTDAARELERAA